MLPSDTRIAVLLARLRNSTLTYKPRQSSRSVHRHCCYFLVFYVMVEAQVADTCTSSHCQTFLPQTSQQHNGAGCQQRIVNRRNEIKRFYVTGPVTYGPREEACPTARPTTAVGVKS
jgi:hypothetical protein